MNVDVVVAIIAGCFSVAGVIIASVVSARKSNQDILAKLENSQNLMEEKIENLTKEIEKHNRVVERMPVAEEKISTLEREVSEIRTATGLKGGKQ